MDTFKAQFSLQVDESKENCQQDIAARRFINSHKNDGT
jgi:hypothetical protein